MAGQQLLKLEKLLKWIFNYKYIPNKNKKMKKILSFALITILLFACAKIEQEIYFRIGQNGYYDYQNIEIDARRISSSQHIIPINTNLSNWEDWTIEYQTPEKDWLIVKKESKDKLYVSVNRANTSKNIRNAKIVFNVNADYNDSNINISQSAFYYTATEQQLLDAKEIVEKVYSTIKMEIDIDTLVPLGSSGSGRFRYSSSSNSANVPIDFRYIFNSYGSHYVSFSSPDDYTTFPRLTYSTIYTGYNSSGGYQKGDFNITLDYGAGVRIRFTQNGD
jgi:hypothetical protein